MKRALFFIAGVTAAVPIVGNLLWRRASDRIEQALLAGTDKASGAVTPEQFAGVPEPVARYFRRTLQPHQPTIRVARIRQSGEFFLNGSWRPMRAEQLFSSTPPAFMWDARISAAPFLPVYVRDAYVNGQAMMRADMLAVYPVVNQAGAPELNSGALLRYLGEAAWLPTRLLPGAGLTWRGIDDARAEATLTHGTTTVSLQFTFNEQGDIVELYAPDRFREVNGSYVPTPWRVRALGHDEVGGIRMMASSVAEWLLPAGPLPYWRGTITNATFVY